MDVVFKEGMLYLQGVKFGKRTWRKIWMVLFKASPTGVGRLEFSTVVDTNTTTDMKKIGRQKTPERKVVRLSDCLSVTTATKESCPQGCTAFYLNTTQCTYTLASMTSQDWISAFCLLAFQKDPGESDKGGLEKGNDLNMEDNDLYSSWKSDMTIPPNQYQVTVQSTEASRRCKLAGEYLVSPQKEAVILLASNTGRIIYNWPYKLLRKFGQVEGGFSIEAGRRCESGEGVFIFLSIHGSLILQTILEQCSVKRELPVQSVHRESLCDLSPIILPTASKQPTDPVYSTVNFPIDMEDDFDNHYSTVDEASAQNSLQLSFVRPCVSDSNVAMGEEDGDEDERCHSLENLKLDNDMDDNIYCNLVRKDLFKPETDDPECIYSDVEIGNPPSNPQLQPFSSLPQPMLQPPSCTLPQSVYYAPLKPRYQHQPSVNNYNPPGYNAQAEAEDNMKEMEEVISSSTHAAPTEAPGSFKHRLAEIISKDLAKLQLPIPSRGASPTLSQ